MMEMASDHTVSSVRTLQNPLVCKIDTIFVGDNSAAIDSAKEMLINAYVKSLIDKGNTGDIY